MLFEYFNFYTMLSTRATAILPILLILPKNPAKVTLAGFSGRIGKAWQDF